jgi:hypothetical protein
MTRVTVVAVAVVLAACGGGDPEPPVYVPLPTLALVDAPHWLAPGQPLAFTPSIDGDATGMQLAIVLVPPGPAFKSDGPRYLMTGAAPATGAPLYLAPDGTWSGTPVARAADPATAPISVGLPSDATGEWSVTATLRSEIGRVVAIDRAVFLVGNDPMLRLAMSRRWANLSDPVSIVARLGPPDLAETLQLLAWITLPDGRQRTLPTLGAALTPSSVPARTRDEALLFDGTLEPFGPGDYDVEVRLVDPATGALVSTAGAGFTVCAQRGMLRGTVVDAGGAPLGGGASHAMLELTPLDRASGAGVIDIDAAGAFATELPVGAWSATGLVVDGRGAHDIPSVVFEVGCEGETSLALAATAPLTSARILAAAGEPPTPAAAARLDEEPPPWFSGCEVKINVRNASFIRFSSEEDLRMLKLFDQKLVRRGSMRGIQFVTEVATTQVATESQDTQRMGFDDSLVLRELRSIFYAQFVLLRKFSRTSRGALRMSSIYIEPIPGEVPRDFELREFGPTANNYVLTATDIHTLVESIVDDGALASLHQSLKPVLHPAVTITASEPQIAGMPVQIYARLYDECNDANGPAGQTIALRSAFGSPSAPTDANGGASFTLSTSENDRGGAVVGVYTSGLDVYESPQVVLDLKRPGEADLVADRVSLNPTQSTNVRLAVPPPPPSKPGGPPAAGPAGPALFALTVTGGTPSVDEVTAGAGEVGLFAVRAGLTEGLATVEARAPDGQFADLYLAVEPPYLVQLVAQPQRTQIPGGALDLEATIRTSGNGQLVGAGLPVTFSLPTGGGTLSETTAQTDAHGVARTRYTAPATTGTYPARATVRGATDSIDLVIVPPCPGCPLSITSNTDHCAKGGTIQFHANQLASWSTTKGSIDANGVLACPIGPNDGGIWMVTANSLENPGTTGSMDFLVDCSDTDLAGMYTGTQEVVIDDPLGAQCFDPGTAITTVTVDRKEPPTSNWVDITYAAPDCTSTYGYGDFQFPPRIIERCTVSYVRNVSGCLIDAFTASVIEGPGVHKIQGSVVTGMFDGACHPGASVSYEATRQ